MFRFVSDHFEIVRRIPKVGFRARRKSVAGGIPILGMGSYLAFFGGTHPPHTFCIDIKTKELGHSIVG